MAPSVGFEWQKKIDGLDIGASLSGHSRIREVVAHGDRNEFQNMMSQKAKKLTLWCPRLSNPQDRVVQSWVKITHG